MIFMKLDGIAKATGGTKTHLGNDGWMVLNSVQWGTGRSATSTAGNRQGDGVSISEVVVTKELDAASYRLFEESCSGKGKTATIHFTKTDTESEKEYMEYVLENSLVTGFSVSSGGGRPQEVISLNFTQIQFNQTELDEANSEGGPNRTAWDLASNSKP
jgi:type VI secretion system secreted protein Hcp